MSVIPRGVRILIHSMVAGWTGLLAAVAGFYAGLDPYVYAFGVGSVVALGFFVSALVNWMVVPWALKLDKQRVDAPNEYLEGV